MIFQPASDIQNRINLIVKKTGMIYIDPERIKCFRSFGSKSKAIARVWSFPKIWQIALNTKPHYLIEVISERFDKLDQEKKDKVLIHELLHIPLNFSGSLLPHKSRGRTIEPKVVNKLFKKMEG